MQDVRISVVVPCFNAERYVARTLDSILAQDVPAAEVIVVNDGSTDGTRGAVEPYSDSIRYLEIPNSGGPSKPRNIGIEQATGDVIVFCDADDLMLPDKLAETVRVFAQYPEVDFLFTNFLICGETDQVLVPDFLARYHDFRSSLRPTSDPGVYLMEGRNAFRHLLRANFIGTSSVACRAKVLADVGGFDESMANSEDVDLWRRIGLHGTTFGFVDRILHRYRYHEESVSHGGSKVFPGQIAGLEKQLQNCEVPADRELVDRRIHDLWLGYGMALRREGEMARSREAYRTALAARVSWAGIRGLVMTLVRPGR